MNEIKLRVPTFDEAVAVENYKNASKEALSGADGLADKIVAAAFSFATAYGAVLALVAPKDTPADLVAVLPFLFFAGAVGLALYSQSVGISLAGTAKVTELHSAVKGVVDKKRLFNRIALGSLIVAVAIAGVIVNEGYGGDAEDDSTVAVKVWLTKAGHSFYADACGKGAEVVFGSVEDSAALTSNPISLSVDKTVCPAGGGELVLSRALVTGVKGVAAQ